MLLRGAAAGRRRRPAGCAACAGRRSAGSRRPGRRRWTVRARRRPPAEARRAAPPRAARPPPRSAGGSPVVGVDEQLLAGLGVLHHQQAQVGQLHLQRIVEPHRDDLVALREAAPAPRAQPGALMKSDTTNTSERRRMTLRARRAAVRSRSVAVGAQRRRGRLQHPVQDVQHVAPAAARRDHRVDVGRRRTSRRRGCRGGSAARASTRDEFGRQPPACCTSPRAEVHRRATGRAGTTRRPRGPR